MMLFTIPAVIRWLKARHCIPVVLIAALCCCAGQQTAFGQSSESNQETANDAPLNCVDRCITEFARLSGNPISYDELKTAVEKEGLSLKVAYRSLADCQRILRQLDFSTTAIHLKLSRDTNFPRFAIVYLAPEITKSANGVGHVVVISPSDNDGLRIFSADDSEPPESFVKRAELNLDVDTFAIVLTGVARREAAIASLKMALVAAGIGGALACLYVGCRRRTTQALSQSSPAATVLLAIAGLLINGCGPTYTNDPVIVGESSHDFGVVVGSAAMGTLLHDFKLTNRTDHVINIDSVVTSCGCVVAQLEHDKSIDARGSIVLPIALNIANKVGPFQEAIVLRFTEPNLPTLQLSLSGFAQKDPRPAASPLTMQFSEEGTTAAEAVVSYMRKPDGRPAKLRDFQLEDGSLSAGENFFKAESPRHEEHVAGDDAVTEIWRFPIHFNSVGQSGAKARLLINWEHPPGQTAIDLVGERLPPIVLHSRQVHLPPVSFGKTHTERVPIRVNDEEKADNLVVISDQKSMSGAIDVKTSRLILSFSPEALGDFDYHLRITENGDTIDAIQVLGTAQ